MSKLEQLQRALQAHVLYGEPAISSAIDASPEVSADVRLAVYADAYRLRLIEALESNFPVLAKAFEQFEGETSFGRLTQLYLAANPSRHFSIRWFGHLLADFLRKFPDYASYAWAAELAEWEWKVAAAFDSVDQLILTIEDLGAIAPADWSGLRFRIHPSVQRMTVATNIVPMLKAAAADASLPKPESLPECGWLIYRRELKVEYRSLEAAEARAFDAIRDGASFGELCELLTEHFAEHEVPLRAASYLKQWTLDHCLIAPEV